ncbi:MAG: enoyl-ACP reductase [Chloroherpetonaceae bacterium]|nr:enoyl-ACP reductase [Chloroherpetonaceae bacterium]MCS7211282.1 enoyl-ACP reductase [Chloroherpetonaceae bacterium]MDW8019702.1 enoyl-ACP reductase [Chloroherpetonaceae bacterium]
MSERKSYGLLKGKKGIVFGPFDESSLGWNIALAAHREGAEVVVSNIAVAARFGKVKQLAEMLGTPLILCDVTNMDELNAAFTELKEKVGSVDFIVHSVGMSQNIRKERPYEDLNYDWFIKTLDVSAISLHRIISVALKHDAINDFGSIIALSYIAAQRNYWTYSDMGDAKALLESIVRSYGPRLARRGIRINTISQSPTYTRAGSGIEDFDKMFEFANLHSPLGNATAEECADFAVVLLSDLTRKVTMQNIYHDGGYSMMGTTLPFIRLVHAALQHEDLVRQARFEEFMPPNFKSDVVKASADAPRS